MDHIQIQRKVPQCFHFKKLNLPELHIISYLLIGKPSLSGHQTLQLMALRNHENSTAVIAQVIHAWMQPGRDQLAES
jgi:hypothetical protein